MVCVSVEQIIDFSNDTYLYYEITNKYEDYKIRYDGKNKDFNIVINKGQFRELLELLVEEEFIIIDENNKIKVEV